MTCGARKNPPGPRTVTAGRGANEARGWTVKAHAPAPTAAHARACRSSGSFAPIPGLGFALALALLLTLALVPDTARAASQKVSNTPPGCVVSEIKVEGNVSVSNDKIRGKLLTKVGSPLDKRSLIADVQSLMKTSWFSEVTPYFEPDKRDATGKSYIVYYTVKEMPILTKVEFRGRTKIKLKAIEESTGLKVGNRADATAHSPGRRANQTAL